VDINVARQTGQEDFAASIHRGSLPPTEGGEKKLFQLQGKHSNLVCRSLGNEHH
jgi:hypothetical protein